MTVSLSSCQRQHLVTTSGSKELLVQRGHCWLQFAVTNLLLLAAGAAGGPFARQVDLEQLVPCPPAMELVELPKVLELLARGWEQ